MGITSVRHIVYFFAAKRSVRKIEGVVVRDFEISDIRKRKNWIYSGALRRILNGNSCSGLGKNYFLRNVRKLNANVPFVNFG